MARWPLQGWPLFIAELKRVTINLHTVNASAAEERQHASGIPRRLTNLAISASRFIITRPLIRRGSVVSLHASTPANVLLLLTTLNHLLLNGSESNFISRQGTKLGNDQISILRLVVITGSRGWKRNLCAKWHFPLENFHIKYSKFSIKVIFLKA